MAEAPEGPQTPQPITTADVWNLKADPDLLDTLATAWRKVKSRASSAEEKVNSAAHTVFSEEHWTGDTATSFNDYRKKLTQDVELFASHAEGVANVLAITATTLRVQQGLLDTEREKLNGVPSTAGADGQLTFRPRDSEQAGLVSGAISAAREIRGRVNDVLDEKREDLEFYQVQLDAIAEQWRPRSVRLINLNVGQGAGNAPGDAGGTDSDELDDIAQVIADENADIATLQEVFEVDMGSLERELEERTGDEWQLTFGEASSKYQASDDWPILGDRPFSPFGNAVLVREGDDIQATGDTENIKLDVDGGSITLPGNGPGEGNAEIEDGEGRSAAVAEVEIQPR
ncbi:hypothetical protein [Nonomuraea sp. B1E8]|uniref:WXG100 family type VII secretion target n=1 Tax=unclassified Nonomuraea TaxID=2593643 RepID=UPI00325C95EB